MKCHMCDMFKVDKAVASEELSFDLAYRFFRYKKYLLTKL